MAMTSGFKDLLATYGGTQITHIGLVNSGGTELSGGTPTYARKAVTWAAVSGGTIRPNADLTFDVPAGTVGGWRGYTALSGGTDHGGATLTTETFAAQGQYKLLAASTGITVSDGA